MASPLCMLSGSVPVAGLRGLALRPSRLGPPADRGLFRPGGGDTFLALAAVSRVEKVSGNFTRLLPLSSTCAS